ncbi:ATP-binding cassette domain-containing protein [Ilyobacter polytropus]|uniref:ATPase involved in cell division n=1 Tax=Ilyobacter polytropus (strain ATCC 51220 / DSM 2926 / LMG 16218 / CuHBu1) TaxID=572544 RepID=E3H831_ILYPC|nr:ATP-binding cassette domain-containing protein [Ilyobacter polytropus]ADO83262.1 ATPase involved in cell division [Ilyobacter polytropus DSM 2926]
MVKFVNVNLNGKTEVNLELNKCEFSYLSYKDKNEKNLFLQMLTKVALPKKGTIIIGGEDFTSSKAGCKIIIRKLGITYDDYKFISYKTIMENLQYYLNLRDYTDKEASKLSLEVLEFFDLAHKKDEFLENLTQEEKHYFSLARALSSEPSYLVMDDFHRGLDDQTIKKVFLLLEELCKNGLGIMYITNDVTILEKYPKDLNILGEGVIKNV